MFLLGKRARDVRILCRGKRISAVASMTVDGFLDAYCTTGSVKEVFCNFVERKLLSQLMPFDGANPRSIVMLDNASIHHTGRAVELIQSVGALVHFIPPYSPDLNPIEELFSKVKACSKENDKAMQAADDRALEDFIYAGFLQVTPSDCFGWFQDSGYYIH